MGLFDRFLGRASRATPASPDALRERLIDAVHAGDAAALARLCAENETAVLQCFPAWQTVPEPVRGDHAALQRYGQGLIGIAQCFAQTRNRAELLQRLTGTPDTNPIARWQQAMGRARALMDPGDFEGALRVLTAELEHVRTLSGGDVAVMHAVTLGQLATCHFQLGRADTALPLLQQALELSGAAGDMNGVTAYLGSLFEVLRYLGRNEEAASAAEAYAAKLERAGNGGQARRYQKWADLVRRGEPLNRVVAELNGVQLELDELPHSFQGSLRFLYCRNRISLAPAMALVRQGGALGSQGRFEEALALFRQARAADPHAPEPVYEEAGTLLHLRRAAEALACYERVEALAPGWYHCRAERWLAAGIASGRIPHAAFSMLNMLEHPELDAPERMRLAGRGIREAPGVSAFHLQLGRDLAVLGRKEEARDVFAEGLHQASEPDIRSRLLVEASNLDTDAQARERKLHEAMAPGGNLVAAAMAAVMLRAGRGPLH